MKKLLICFLLIICGSVVSSAQDVSRELQKEEDGFCWYLLQKSSSSYTTIWGAEDVDGNVIIPLDLECNIITYKRSKSYPFFYATKYIRKSKKESTSITGIFSVNGHEIIPLSRNYRSIYFQNYTGVEYFDIAKDTLVNRVKDGKVKQDKIMVKMQGACDMSGKEIVAPKYYGLIYTAEGFQYGSDWPLKKLNVFLDENGLLSTSGYGKVLRKNENDGHQWYDISQNGVHGVLDLEGNEIIPLSRGYSSIYYTSEYGGYYSCQLNNRIFSCDLKGNVMDKYKFMALQESFQKKENEGIADKKSALKSMLSQANEMPKSEVQKKLDLYMQVVNADSDGSLGYKAVAFNNIGIMYYNMEDYKNAKLYFEKSLEVAPSYADAQANLKLAKSARRSQRLDNVIGVLGAIGEVASTISGSQTGGTYNAYQGSGGVYSGSSTTVGNNTMASTQGNSVTVSDDGNTTRIDLPGGGYMLNTKNEDGSVNSQAYQPCIICHGSKTCAVCFGQGGVYNRAYNYWTTCTSCGGRKTCNFCNGTGYSAFVSHTDANGNGYGASNSGYTTTRNAGGVTVTNSDGKTTVYSNGGDTASERSSQSSSSKGTCSKCNGRKYESTSYSALPASAHGWAQPYRHSGGTGCPYCTSVAIHYHAPCNSCRGFGHN